MIKRGFDFLSALIGLIVLSPIFILLMILLWLQDFGSPFFCQERVGRDGRLFWMVKFRSMKMNISGASLTAENDPRITPLGKILRKSKFDELPQLWNVLVGDMSLVGPRPELAKFARLFNEEQRKVLTVRPGITGPASIAYFNEEEILAKVPDPERYYIEKLMSEKINLNLAYQKRATFFSDLQLIWSTLARMF